ncbi:hypothetical protein Syun_021000 [Stephania yunnanensis]|uniref:Uncharacterized protein n=1 Tax=Stephania yunnanensis TaxID=152371 RepID=A0AAP0NPD7_9MAGN
MARPKTTGEPLPRSIASTSTPSDPIPVQFEPYDYNRFCSPEALDTFKWAKSCKVHLEQGSNDEGELNGWQTGKLKPMPLKNLPLRYEAHGRSRLGWAAGNLANDQVPEDLGGSMEVRCWTSEDCSMACGDVRVQLGNCMRDARRCLSAGLGTAQRSA